MIDKRSQTTYKAKSFSATLEGDPIYSNPPTGGLLLGTEFIFNNNSGFSIYGGFNDFLTIGANYVYESSGFVRWAVLTGFDGGIDLYGNNNEKIIGMLRYELGIRLRKNHHAISLNIKVPLFKNEIHTENKNATATTEFYPGITPTIRYTYFF